MGVAGAGAPRGPFRGEGGLGAGPADGAAYQSDLRVRAADGGYRWVASRGAPMRGPDGDILAWVGTVTDIDDQKRQERRLRRSQRELAATAALLDALQTAAPVGLAFIDRQFRKLRVNEALARLTGLAVEDQIGRPAAEITPDLWPQLEPIYRSVLYTGEPVLNVEVTRASGAVPGGTDHCLSSFYPVRVDAEVVGVGVVVVDITERRQAEGLLAANLDALVRTIAATVEVRDPYTAGHQTARGVPGGGDRRRAGTGRRRRPGHRHRRRDPRHRQDRGASRDIEQARASRARPSSRSSSSTANRATTSWPA